MPASSKNFIVHIFLSKTFSCSLILALDRLNEWCISLCLLWTVDMRISHVIINTVMTASRYQSRTFIGHSNIITHNTSIVEQSDWHLSACILLRLPKSVTTSFEFNCLVLFAKPRNTADSRVVFSQNSHNGHHRARPSGQVYTESLESKIGHMFYLCHCCIVQSVMVYSIKMSGWRLTTNTACSF